jgi:hypothetical protein
MSDCQTLDLRFDQLEVHPQRSELMSGVTHHDHAREAFNDGGCVLASLSCVDLPATAPIPPTANLRRGPIQRWLNAPASPSQNRNLDNSTSVGARCAVRANSWTFDGSFIKASWKRVTRITIVTNAMPPLSSPLQKPTRSPADMLPVRYAATRPPIPVTATAPSANQPAKAYTFGRTTRRFPKTGVPPKFPRMISPIHIPPIRRPTIMLSFFSSLQSISHPLIRGWLPSSRLPGADVTLSD